MTNNPLTPDKILKAHQGLFKELVVLGWDHNDDLLWRTSVDVSVEDLLFLLEMLKHQLLVGNYEED